MRRTSRGAGCRAWRQNAPASWIWHLESEAKNRKSDKSAPVAPCKCRSEHGAAKALVPARTRPSSGFTSAGVLLLFYCFVTNLLHRRQRKKGKGNVTVTPESQVPASLICIPPRRLHQAPPYGGGGFSFEHRARGSAEEPPRPKAKLRPRACVRPANGRWPRETMTSRCPSATALTATRMPARLPLATTATTVAARRIRR